MVWFPEQSKEKDSPLWVFLWSLSCHPCQAETNLEKKIEFMAPASPHLQGQPYIELQGLVRGCVHPFEWQSPRDKLTWGMGSMEFRMSTFEFEGHSPHTSSYLPHLETRTGGWSEPRPYMQGTLHTGPSPHTRPCGPKLTQES